jgi:hypothetical protein
VLSELIAASEYIPAVLDAFMARRWDRCRLVVEASLQVGEWELNPTPTSVNDAIALGNHVRTMLAHAF